MTALLITIGVLVLLDAGLIIALMTARRERDDAIRDAGDEVYSLRAQIARMRAELRSLAAERDVYKADIAKYKERLVSAAEDAAVRAATEPAIEPKIKGMESASKLSADEIIKGDAVTAGPIVRKQRKRGKEVRKHDTD